jgi:hypothetical protein
VIERLLALKLPSVLSACGPCSRYAPLVVVLLAMVTVTCRDASLSYGRTRCSHFTSVVSESALSALNVIAWHAGDGLTCAGQGNSWANARNTIT